MPQAVAGWLAGALLAGATTELGVSIAIAVANYGAAALTIGAIAISGYEQKKAQNKAADAAKASYLASLQDRTTVVRSPILARNILLGRTRTSGALACWFTWGDLKQKHTFAVTLAGHACDAVESYYFNDELVTLDGSGYVTNDKWCKLETLSKSEFVTFDAGGHATISIAPNAIQGVFTPNGDGNAESYYTGADVSFTSTTVTCLAVANQSGRVAYTYVNRTPLFLIRTYLGQPGQAAAPELIAAAAAAGTPGAWDASRRGTQICYCTVEMTADLDVMGDLGVPNVGALVRGVQAYDPRTGLTVWTQNPPLLERWFLVDSIYSPKTSSAEISTSDLIASANVSDEAVNFGAFIGPRYVCNGSLSTDATPLDNLRHINMAMDGGTVWIGGQWQIIAGYYQAATLTVSESSLDESAITLSPSTTKDQLVNTIAGTFPDSSQAYTRTSFPAVTVAAYVTQDGGESFPQDMDFALVDNPLRCQMIAWQRLTRARQPLTVQLGTNLKGYDMSPLKTVALQLAEFGFASKEFTVRRRNFAGSTLNYVLQATGAAVWAWQASYATQPAAVNIPNTTLPDVRNVPALALTGTFSGTAALLKGGDGTIISRIGVNWTAVTNIYVTTGGKIEWQYQLLGAAAWLNGPPVPGSATSTFISPLQDGLVYTIRGRCVTASGRAGDWTYATIKVIGKTEPPTTPSNISLTQSFVYWKGVTDDDLDGYLVRYIPGAVANWGQGTPLINGVVTQIPLPMPKRLYGINTIMVVAVDTTGNISGVISASLDYGQPNAANIAQSYDFQAAGFPGTFTNCSVVGGNLVANVDPVSNIYALADVYSQADLYATQYLAMQWVSTPFTPRYGGGTMTLSGINALIGAGALVEYQIDGGVTNDIYALADVYAAADLYGASSNFQVWPGALDVGRMQSVVLRVTIAAGTTQGVISAFVANLALQEQTQSFTAFSVAAGGSRLTPGAGTPPLNFVTIRDVQMTAVVDGSGAMFGRQLDYSPALGSLVQGLDQTFTPVTGKFNISQKGLVDV